MNRRHFIRKSLLASAASTLAAQAAASPAPVPTAPPSAAAAAATCPVGKLGNLTLSRLILGSNLITFYIHNRGLKFVNTLARHYNTEEKILETLAIADDVAFAAKAYADASKRARTWGV